MEGKLVKGEKYDIAILGAGISGLYTALYFEELNKKGYNINYEILERDGRVGGRIKTHNFD